MSYLEVILGAVILGLMIPPIFSWMLQGAKMREEIKRTHQTTIQAQNLIQEIKISLNQNSEQVEKLIRENHDEIIDLESFLIGESYKLEGDYQMNRYIYELSIRSGEGQINLSTCTPEELLVYGYKVESIINEGEVNLDIEAASLLFEGDQYLRESLGGVCKIGVCDKEGILESDLIGDRGEKVEQVPLEGPKGPWGKVIKINTSKGIRYDLEPDKSDEDREIKIVVDFTQIAPQILKRWMEEGNMPLITIRSMAKSTLLIQMVLTNAQELSLEQMEKDKLITIQKHKETPVTIQVSEQLNDQESYWLTLVVRDKKPTIGEPGKVVKKRLDLYTPE